MNTLTTASGIYNLSKCGSVNAEVARVYSQEVLETRDRKGRSHTPRGVAALVAFSGCPHPKWQHDLLRARFAWQGSRSALRHPNRPAWQLRLSTAHINGYRSTALETREPNRRGGCHGRMSTAPLRSRAFWAIQWQQTWSSQAGVPVAT